jgi:hypothetical protein
MDKDQLSTHTKIPESHFLTTYSFKKGLQQFGNRGERATLNEMQQLNDRRYPSGAQTHLEHDGKEASVRIVDFSSREERWYSEGVTAPTAVRNENTCNVKRCQVPL